MVAPDQAVVDENVEALPEPVARSIGEKIVKRLGAFAEALEKNETITEADQLEQIAEVAVECRLAAVELNKAKAVMKDRKAEYEGCVLKLLRLAEAIRNDEERPLFDGLKDGQEENVDDGGYKVCLGAQIAVLELRPHVEGKLNGAEVWTVGDLEGLRKDISLSKAIWPKGIGPTAVTEIESKVTDYVAANCQEEVDDADQQD